MTSSCGASTDKVKDLRQGPPAGPGSVDVGAVIFPPQLDVVDAHVRDAVAKGANVLTGGHAHTDGGRFYEPTVLVDVDHTMDIMREETFGPAVPIMRVADVDEAVRLANDSRLRAAGERLDRATPARGEEIARRLESGVVCVNDAQVNYYGARTCRWVAGRAPVSSARHGAGGIRKYCRIQSLFVSGFGPRHELLHVPVQRRRTLMLRRLYRVPVRARLARLTQQLRGICGRSRDPSICYQLVTSTQAHLLNRL